jgi:hypothetical protein
MTIRMTFIDATGSDITGTEAAAGYHFADFFSSDIAEMEHEAAGDAETLNQWLRSAYLGPDVDGVQVTWSAA